MKRLLLTAFGAMGMLLAWSQEDVTATYVANPSFENGLTGWSVSGMQTQTNSYFPKKDGGTYCEAWVNRGSALGSCSVEQTLANLPSGSYRLTVGGLHIQQSGQGSSENIDATPQTGASFFAGDWTVEFSNADDWTVEFISLGGDMPIGMRAVDATGNWLAIDNFRLCRLGDLTNAMRAQVLQKKIDDLTAGLLTQPMQEAVKTAMLVQIEDARTLIGEAGTASEADYALSVDNMLKALAEKEAACEQSAALYAKLAERIAHAEKVQEWVVDDLDKVNTISNAISVAKGKYADYTLTDEALAQAVTDLNTAIRKVDKEIYSEGSWLLGDIYDPNNDYYIGRSVESKDWILFWQKGYGDEIPVNQKVGNYTVNVWDVLDHAQIAFDFYCDELKYINRETSKTAKYKMIIRLRYEESVWEATGSGFNDCIGLLTLTPWALTSRNWQTLYHEIGHCFQYQVHCDNNNQNGWMYTVGDKGCAFWEQCAQWQAYKIMPQDQFTNEWYSGYLENAHKHILHESPRYNNFFIMDYWTMLHGWDFMGRLWNESQSPEDAVKAYQRITDISNEEFNDEMWDCAARFTTWDIDHLAPYQNNTWKQRKQPTFKKDADGYWAISADNAPENTGYNVVQLNVPAEGGEVAVVFEGLAGNESYRSTYAKRAGWRYGFVALKKDGTRVYGTPGKSATYFNPKEYVSFECPADCERLWLVVTGAMSRYSIHGWDDDDSNDEQFGYRLYFGNTNLSGKANTDLTSVTLTGAEELAVPTGVYTMQGVKVRDNDSLEGLPAGIYIVNGRKVAVRP